MGNPRLPDTIKPILVKLNSRIPMTLWEELTKTATRQDRTQRAVIEDALRLYLERCKKAHDAEPKDPVVRVAP